MPTNKQIVDLIEQWSGKRPDSMAQVLEDWWNETAPGSTHSALAYADGIDDLVKRIKKAFPPPPSVVAADFKSAGAIKTMEDLVDALQPVATRQEDSADSSELVAKSKPEKKSGKARRKKRKVKRERAGKSKKRGSAKTGTTRGRARKNSSAGKRENR